MKSLKKLSLFIIAAAMCSMATGCYEDEWDDSEEVAETTAAQTAASETETEAIETTVAAVVQEINETGAAVTEAVQTDASEAEEPNVQVFAPVEETTEPAGIIAGGFSNEVIGGYIPMESLYAWKDAFKNLDEIPPEPIALLGTQVVGGINHSFLCQEADGKLMVYTIFERRWLDKSEIISKTEIDFNALEHTDSAAPLENPQYTNAWTVNAEEYKSDENLQAFPERAAAAFKKASSSLPEDIVLMPQAYLGSQVVAGTNYRILCVSKDADYEKTNNASIKVATVYEDLNGNAEFIYFADLKAADYLNN